MRQPSFSTQFERVRRAEKRGKDIGKLKRFLALVVAGRPLPSSYRDHPLKGEWANYRDSHLEPDWLVIYRIDGGNVRFQRTGRHSDLFDE